VIVNFVHSERLSGSGGLVHPQLAKIAGSGAPDVCENASFGRMEYDPSRQQRLQQELADNTAQLLSTDIELAMTMARLAEDAARGSEKRERNLQNARKGYQDVARVLAKMSKIRRDQAEELTAKLQRLHNLIAEVEAA
jgi:hypothetical protein